jgi:hypothetical protein
MRVGPDLLLGEVQQQREDDQEHEHLPSSLRRMTDWSAAAGPIQSAPMSGRGAAGTIGMNAVLHLRRASEPAASAGSRNDR